MILIIASSPKYNANTNSMNGIQFSYFTSKTNVFCLSVWIAVNLMWKRFAFCGWLGCMNLISFWFMSFGLHFRCAWLLLIFHSQVVGFQEPLFVDYCLRKQTHLAFHHDLVVVWPSFLRKFVHITRHTYWIQPKIANSQDEYLIMSDIIWIISDVRHVSFTIVISSLLNIFSTEKRFSME